MGMPRGVPSLGQSVVDDLTHAPQPEVLGELRSRPAVLPVWKNPETLEQVTMEEGPPPWEKQGSDGSSDAHQFVTCPQEWVLYWINPKLLEALGWRGWSPVRVNDERVGLLVPSMQTPDGMVRRGGPNGDILAYMPRHWYESRKKEYADRNAAQTQTSVDRMERLKEEFARGTFGPNIRLDSAKHPTHTIGRPVDDPA